MGHNLSRVSGRNSCRCWQHCWEKAVASCFPGHINKDSPLVSFSDDTDIINQLFREHKISKYFLVNGGKKSLIAYRRRDVYILVAYEYTDAYRPSIIMQRTVFQRAVLPLTTDILQGDCNASCHFSRSSKGPVSQLFVGPNSCEPITLSHITHSNCGSLNVSVLCSYDISTVFENV